MMVDILFHRYNKYSLHKFNEEDFSLTTPIHDWRNHVPDEFINDWKNLTERERKIIFIMAEIASDMEATE